MGTTTSSRNSSQNSAWPVIWVIGRSSTPGERMSTISIEMPRCLGAVVVGAGEHAAPARELAPRHPRLLPADDEVVVVLDGARAQRREVGPGLGLGEPLAPDLLGREDRRDVAAALLVGAEAQQRRPEHVEADDVDELGRAGGGELLVDDDLLGGRPPPPPNSRGHARPT